MSVIDRIEILPAEKEVGDDIIDVLVITLESGEEYRIEGRNLCFCVEREVARHDVMEQEHEYLWKALKVVDGELTISMDV